MWELVFWVITRYRILVVTDISEQSSASIIRVQNFYSQYESGRFFTNYMCVPLSDSRYYEDDVGVVEAYKIMNKTCVVRKIFNVKQQVEEKWEDQDEIVGRPENDLLELKEKK
jgi:hypothetical protein